MCLDTDILVGILRNDSDALRLVNETKSELAMTTTISSYELMKGASISSRPRENLTLVGELLNGLNVLPLDKSSSALASSIYSEVKDRKLTIGEFDILIAAITMQNDQTLVTRDKHFKGLKNLSLKIW